MKKLEVPCRKTQFNMGTSSECPRCSSTDEDLEHLLRSCQASRTIWDHLDGPARISNFYTLPVNEWIEQNASNASSDAPYNWASEFAITLWWLWKWRCNVVFGQDEDIPLDTKGFLYRQFALTKGAFDRFDIFTPRTGAGNIEVFIRWSPPPHNWVLLNTDGAAKGNPGLAGCGGLFRDSSGDFISGYHKNIGICSAMRAELIALAIGLEEASRMGIRKLMIRTDNAACVGLLKNEELISNNLRSLVHGCKAKIAAFNGEVHIDHCYREANRAADWLANKGVQSMDDFVVFESPPLSYVLFLEMM